MTNLRKQSGSTLIELILVGALIAVMVGATINFFSSSQSGSTSSKLVSDINLLAEATDNYLIGYGNPGNGSLNKWLINSKKVPSDLSTNGETISTSFGGTIDIQVSGNAYSISISNVPRASCIAFLSSLPASWQTVKVGGSEIADKPITVAQAHTQCSSTNNNIVLEKDFF